MITTHVSMASRAYRPAAETREIDFKFAAAGLGAVYGVTAPNAPAAPGKLSFGEFARRPETLELFGAPDESDATCLLLELQQAFPGEASRKDLSQFVRKNHSGKPRGFRYWDRLAGSTWKMYQGMQRGKERTQKAHDGEIKRLATAAKRANKEVKRSASRRIATNEADRRALPAKKLRARAQWLVSRSNTKAALAKTLAQDAADLRMEADKLESQARDLEQSSAPT
jgi:hypothetical protein